VIPITGGLATKRTKGGVGTIPYCGQDAQQLVRW
jgi:hypothetical protein